MTGRRIVLALLLALGLLPALAPAPRVAAQDCAPATPQTPAEAYDGASAVFVGKVDDVAGAYDNSLSAAVNVITFTLQSAWKQPLTGPITAETQTGDCQVPFKPGDTWLVYALNAGNTLFVPYGDGSEPFD